LPWDERTKALFGQVDHRCERHGFIPEGVPHGRHNTTTGLPRTALPARALPFHPPELIIQDELHLIAGPLGSLVGIYETALDFLCGRGSHRPKIIASTATIRRYQDQIGRLFDRKARQFPPPGLIAGESFFAAESQEIPGRVYVGICTPGKSLKTTAVRVIGSLLHSIDVLRRSAADDVVDPYWTLVSYFNSLRELGGALRLLDDDVPQRIRYLAGRGEPLSDLTGAIWCVYPPRRPARRPELTSRIPSREIPALLRQMEQVVGTGQALDVLLATNMISVGVDIQRFGLMMVTGQPKTSAEYIQATSRVGRRMPGLILTLCNWSRPRDLSHYERFKSYHSMMYRHVEAGSVTPFSPRARDKGLHAVLIALLRLLIPGWSPNDAASRFVLSHPLVREVVDFFLARIRHSDPDEVTNAEAEIHAFLDGWQGQATGLGANLRYGQQSVQYTTREERRRWLILPAEDWDGSDFPRGTLGSLREVEKASGLYFIRLGSGI
jgi:hypothetical protein